MHQKLKTCAMLCGLSLFALNGAAQLQMKTWTEPNTDNVPAPVHPLPHDRQVKWMETEFYAFYHYGMNTFTNNEWGNEVDAAPSTYQPTSVPNPRQWLEAAKSAHMKGGIAVVKHHDGFCLWPTKTTDYNIANCGNSNGVAGNIPQLFGAAARDLDMKYGFYVSPWDAHDSRYGTEAYVHEVFLKQCKELSEYGDDQFEMWFDGANGGRGKYGGSTLTSRSIDRATYYDVPNLRYMVHKENENCVLWGVGGEARWIGNENGKAGETNWCTDNREDGKDQPNAMQGSENGWMWLPGESDAKATTGGWFWHSGESVTSAERLFQMYLETVGRNSTLILNLPPDKSGSLPTATVNRMKELGDLLDARLGTNLAKGATVTASSERYSSGSVSFDPANVIDGRNTTYYAPADGATNVEITIELPEAKPIHYVVLQEYIRLGQRVKTFKIETSNDKSRWTAFGGSMPTTTIGYKRIIPQNGQTEGSYNGSVTAKYVRVTITDCKSIPVIQNIEVY